MDTPTLIRQDIVSLYDHGLLDLVFEAARIHRRWHDPAEIQCASLLSVKTGGCPEDCAYCPQSAHHPTGVPSEPLMSVEAVVQTARAAKANGADRFCLGAAWREVADGPAFDRVLEMVSAVKALGLETCVTLGCSKRITPHGYGRLGSTITTTIWTPGPVSIPRSSPPACTMTGFEPCVRCASLVSRCAAAESSAWVKPVTIDRSTLRTGASDPTT